MAKCKKCKKELNDSKYVITVEHHSKYGISGQVWFFCEDCSKEVINFITEKKGQITLF